MKIPEEFSSGFGLLVSALLVFAGLFLVVTILEPYSVSVSNVISIAAFIFLILDILLAIGVINHVRKILFYYKPLSLDHRSLGSQGTIITIERKPIMERWEKISRALEGDDMSLARLAIIESDSLADDILKKMGFEGEHMAYRLEHMAGSGLRSVDSLWRAHRVRNEVAHSPAFEMSSRLAIHTKEDYESFFREIGILK